MKYTVFNIQYDTDGEQVDLPEKLTIEVPEDLKEDSDIADFISDKISDETGFCHFGFNTDPEINE